MPEATHPYIAVGVTLLIFLTLQLKRGVPTDVLFLGGLMIVTVTGVLSPIEAIAGFSNVAPLTIAGLLVVAAGLRSSGVLDWVGRWLLGTAQTSRAALWRLAPTLLLTSAFMLNTALVAMMMPVILDWCRRRAISPSKLLLPLSYLTILGGVCTLIGTSTTLVVNGMLRDEYYSAQQAAAAYAEAHPDDAEEIARREAFVEQVAPMKLFDVGKVGLPCALAGTVFLLLIGTRIVPDRSDLLERLGEQRREYLAEMLVQPECPLIGKTVEDAGLRHLPGLYLIEIDREGDVITPVTPQDVIHAEDRLVFTGVVSTIVDLERIPGIIPAADVAYEFSPRKRQLRQLTEVVLSRTSPLIGTTVREANFRQRYNAAVVAVHRNGVRLTNKIGNIALEPGDTLLLQTRSNFVAANRNNREFYLVSDVTGAEPRLHHKRHLAAFLALFLIGWLSVGSLLGEDAAPRGMAAVAAITIAVGMIVTRCLRASEARAAIDMHTLLTIAGALGLGKALTESGAAQAIASSLVEFVGSGNPYLTLIVIYLITLVFTETITNNAVAAMLLPIAVAVAWEGQYDPRPFIMIVTLGASLSFLTPIGYQTNLMVMGPGGYRPRDFLRCGIPMAIVVAITALILVPIVWPF